MSPPNSYTLSISRLTIDKLGVKLYDKVSAVVAELIANSYDADATTVTVTLPMGTELASLDSATRRPLDKGLTISVLDDGHGMTPEEAQTFYLKVGRDRREHVGQGSASRVKQRPVMGRKGIGKLAPFGICRRIEVISSGGVQVPGKGFITTHFMLDFDQIVQDEDAAVPLEVGDRDGTYRDTPGTEVILGQFLSKRVPPEDTFHRQMATRFALATPDFTIHLTDSRPAPPVDSVVAKFQVPVVESTRIDLSARPIETPSGEKLPVTGWLALASDPYKHEEAAGVRIYARGKIVATTRDFEQPAGFTGEFTMRSYLVGEIHAEWLDEDHGEDLIRTDRQSILWDSERGEMLRAWGASLIKEIGAASRAPRREKKSAIFMDRANLAERARERYGDAAVVDAAVELGQQIGAFAAEDELADADYVDDLAEVILAVAPHKALVEAFKEISQQVDAEIRDLLSLFGKTRVAEMASYSQIAEERVRSVRELQAVINRPDVEEADLQRLIAAAPWLIRPDWTVLTQNQGLKAFRDQFVIFWKTRYGEDLEVAISYEKKRPDFTLVHHGRKLHLVELKAPGHEFSGADYARLQNYVSALDDFFANNPGLAGAFPDGWQIDLIADSVRLTDETQKYAFAAFEAGGKVERKPWNDFLAGAIVAHQAFLDAYDAAHQDEGGDGG